MAELTVYSGQVKLAVCGVPTPYIDMIGRALFTGDIVSVFTKDCVPDGLTVVVQNQGNSWESNFPDFYIMGIAGVPITEDGEWRVVKHKDHSDVIDGEHWKAFGFRYAATPS